MKLNTFPRLGLAVLVVAASFAASFGAVSLGKPEDVGMSSERLQRINQVVQQYIDSKQISGAVTMVSRKGRAAYFEAQGRMDIESKAAMKKDAIFRLGSTSKPVTG